MSALKNWDMYRRVPKELTESSVHGFILSLCSAVFLLSLLVAETQNFIYPEIVSNAVLDFNQERAMSININVTLLKIPCEFAILNVADSLGRRDFNVSKGILRYRVSDSGKIQRRPFRNSESRGEENQDRSSRDENSDIQHDEHHDLNQLLENGEHAVPIDVEHWDQWLTFRAVTFVNFHTPSCEWCLKLAPVWEAFAEEVFSEQLDVSVVSVDCDHYREFCLSQRVLGFPMLRAYVKGKYSPPEYTYDRTVSAMMTFVKSKLESVLDESNSGDVDQILDKMEKENTADIGNAVSRGREKWQRIRNKLGPDLVKRRAREGGFFSDDAEEDANAVGCNLVGSIKVNRFVYCLRRDILIHV